VRNPFEILREETKILGNHNRKYLLAGELYLDNLKKQLEEKKKMDQVHLWHFATDLNREMAIVSEVGKDQKEKLQSMGCYYGLQYLHMNLSHLNVLKLVSKPNNYELYEDFMITIGNNFRALTAAYMENLLHLLLPGKGAKDFFIASVGTKADQDDIDVGIVDKGTKNRATLNKAISRMAKEMMRFANTIHFHLSEHIGKGSYSASIPEYKSVLDESIGDFIIISEILGATRIIGSSTLFKKFYEEISMRYFFKGNGSNKFNEGFIRGLIGELKSLIIRPLGKNKINPKNDALRIIKGIIAAKKTLFDIHNTNNWGIIDELKERDNAKVNCYFELERALTFFEIFRYIYQLLVVQEEEILIKEPGMIKNIEAVAGILGYEGVGVLKASDHLIVHYYEMAKSIREVVPKLIEDIEKHLRTNSIFIEIFSKQKESLDTEKVEKNLVRRFMKTFRFFRGTTYWEDILTILRTDSTLQKSFLSDLNTLNKEQKDAVINRYIDWVNYDLYSLINLLTIIGKSGKEYLHLFQLFNQSFLKSMEKTSDVTKRLSIIFMCYRKLMYDYLALLDKESLHRFSKFLTDKFLEKELVQERNGLANLVSLLMNTSNYFKRFINRAVAIHPESIRYIEDTERLEEVSKGILGEIESIKGFHARWATLGEYYDLEFLRVGLETLHGTSIIKTNAIFSEFCDNYITILFDICRDKIESEYGKKAITGDLLAVFAAGGHAREQAFNDDYDLIVILDSENEEIRELSTRIIALLNTEISKRGTIPHFRFADYVGNYVMLMSELKDLLKQERDSGFIDKSQILSSRMVVGSEKFRRRYEKRIIYPHIFNKKETYIKDMKQEIDSRHEQVKGDPELENDIKESIGGLRDIEMFTLIYKAQYEITTPVNSKIFDILSEYEPANRDKFQLIGKSFNYLKNLRNIYRLRIAANDKIDISNLEKHDRELFKDFKKTRNLVNTTITSMLKHTPQKISEKTSQKTPCRKTKR
jgi:hypothetical protein